ncbi:MAG: hypothetical protein EBY09_18940, partial [Verrucomicrobia bacterium]|nr:hypothetical protein [Verrucomicrobiota bacterium]
MKKIQSLLLTLLASCLCLTQAGADERRFTYVYEPEVLPKGAMEFEQWVTLRTQRTKGGDVQQGNFNRWQIREELEYGVTDRYSVSLYLNGEATSLKDHSATPPTSSTTTEFTGVSLENRYMLVNPANNPVGVTLYFEPRFSGGEAELEQKIIVGQRHGDWKWAFNLSHAIEWKNDLHTREGELEATFGISRDLGKHWSDCASASGGGSGRRARGHDAGRHRPCRRALPAQVRQVPQILRPGQLPGRRVAHVDDEDEQEVAPPAGRDGLARALPGSRAPTGGATNSTAQALTYTRGGNLQRVRYTARTCLNVDPTTQNAPSSSDGISLVAVLTAVLWLGCLLVGGLGISLPYQRPA